MISGFEPSGRRKSPRRSRFSAKDPVIRIGAVGLAGDHDGGVVHEAGDVVDVAVGVVSFDPRAEPEDLVHAEVGFDAFFDLAAGEIGIAVGIEEDGLGREHLAEAVLLDRAAFEDHAGLEARQTEGVGDVDGDLVVELVRTEFVAPSVETPVGDGEGSGVAVFHEERSVVAAPDVVVGMIVELDLIGGGAGSEDLPTDLLVTPGRGIDAHGFVAADCGGDFGEDGFDLREGLGPAIRMTRRPRKPDRGLWGPFSGHSVAE